jgi:S-adenosylmethionine:diacylglycerol 3-amino-3-carboxypropyl transferase
MDVQDWMNAEQICKLWDQIDRTADLDARVIFRPPAILLRPREICCRRRWLGGRTWKRKVDASTKWTERRSMAGFTFIPAMHQFQLNARVNVAE